MAYTVIKAVFYQCHEDVAWVDDEQEKIKGAFGFINVFYVSPTLRVI
jgi:hypothetical protein